MWEYDSILIRDHDQFLSGLRRAGANDWELVTIVPFSSGAWAILKRLRAE
jgi:hypothetical protein